MRHMEREKLYSPHNSLAQRCIILLLLYYCRAPHLFRIIPCCKYIYLCVSVVGETLGIRSVMVGVETNGNKNNIKKKMTFKTIMRRTTPQPVVAKAKR